MSTIPRLDLATIDRESFPLWAEQHGKTGRVDDLVDDPDLRAAIRDVSVELAQAIVRDGETLAHLHETMTRGQAERLAPMVREAQRHLAGWVLQPMCELLAQEASAKLGGSVMIDVGRPLQAFDAGGRARALGALIDAMGRAKELGLSPDQLNQALLAVNWGGGDVNA